MLLAIVFCDLQPSKYVRHTSMYCPKFQVVGGRVADQLKVLDLKCEGHTQAACWSCFSVVSSATPRSRL